MRIIVGITGASGAIYGLRLLENMKKSGADVSIIVSKTGLEILKMETGIGKEGLALYGNLLENKDLMAPLASGSNAFDAMVVAPCSMKTLACIANGLASTLMVRAAEVALKERRRLVLVARETPLSLIDIKNMEKLTLAGGIVLPACPGFYHSPKTMEDLVDHVVGKVLDQIGVEHSLFKRWGQ
jgi:4-hydroxy-3-polyprenylbenzoate decarboxylase